MIWKSNPTPEMLEFLSTQGLSGHLGIRITAIHSDALEGEMPVQEQHHQPLGLLHGGASAVLAETLGSIAANLCLDNLTHYAVGVELNVSHLRSVRSGKVIGRCFPCRIGRTLQVWQTDIYNEEGKMICTGRLTVAVKSLTEGNHL